MTKPSKDRLFLLAPVAALLFALAPVAVAHASTPGSVTTLAARDDNQFAQGDQERPRRNEEPGIWDIPKGTLAVALVVSALIGAAAGHVYAGIVRPKK